MKKILNRKCLVFGTTALMIGLIFGSVVNAGVPENKHLFDIDTNNSMSLYLSRGYTNITVYEAWDLLNDTSNGIQIPVDVRYDNEWNAGFLDTPYPESPIHYCWDLLKEPETLQIFLDLYDGEDVIMYCAKGGRSEQSCIILVNAGFTGKIYNMLGGTTAWQAAGLPMRGNEQPDAPDITGEKNGKVNTEYEYTFTAMDPDEDGVKYFIDWGDGENDTTSYDYSGEDVTVKHSWDEEGTYNITAKTIDFYGNESDWTTLTVTMPVNQPVNLNKQNCQQPIRAAFFQILEKILFN